MGLKLFAPGELTVLGLPYVGRQIAAGFPSPAEEYFEATLDLNQAVIRNPSATFFGRVKGQSMREAGVDNGDLLVIDRSLTYRHGALAVCWINGEFTLKRIRVQAGNAWLLPANPDYEPIPLSAEDDFTIWGIVTYILKKAY